MGQRMDEWPFPDTASLAGVIAASLSQLMASLKESVTADTPYCVHAQSERPDRSKQYVPSTPVDKMDNASISSWPAKGRGLAVVRARRRFAYKQDNRSTRRFSFREFPTRLGLTHTILQPQSHIGL